MIQLNEKQKRILFNGRTLQGDFRRGLWKKEEYDNFSGKKPILPIDDYLSFLWYKGCIAFYVKGGEVKKIIKNINIKDDDIDSIIEVIKQLNQIDVVEQADLGKATRTSTNDAISRLVF